MGHHANFNAHTALQTMAQTRAEWAAVLSTPAPKRAPVQTAKPGFFARLFGR